MRYCEVNKKSRGIGYLPCSTVRAYYKKGNPGFETPCGCKSCDNGPGTGTEIFSLDEDSRKFKRLMSDMIAEWQGLTINGREQFDRQCIRDNARRLIFKQVYANGRLFPIKKVKQPRELDGGAGLAWRVHRDLWEETGYEMICRPSRVTAFFEWGCRCNKCSRHVALSFGRLDNPNMRHTHYYRLNEHSRLPMPGVRYDLPKGKFIQEDKILDGEASRPIPHNYGQPYYTGDFDLVILSATYLKFMGERGNV